MRERLRERSARLIAGQSSRPRGALGRIWGPVLDRATGTANGHAYAALELEGDPDVLDVGFGGGRLLSRILADSAGAVAGIELSDVMTARARRRFRREIAAGRLRVSEAPVEAIPFGDASFDRVVSVHTIYFWPDAQGGLREIARVLRPGGRLVLATATKEYLSQRRASRYGYRLFAERDLRAALEEAGFADVAVERHETVVISGGRRPG